MWMGLGWSRNLTDSLSCMEQAGLSRDNDGFLGTLVVDSRLQMVLFNHWYPNLLAVSIVRKTTRVGF